MNRSALVCTALASICLLAAAAVISRAGPLNPPAGPGASSYKALSEVEPRIAINATTTPGDADSIYRISQPGSYYLTGNIAGVAGKRGIEIATGGVSIDLMGFDLAGAAGSLQGVSVVTGVAVFDVEVRNGNIHGWGGVGLDMNDFVSNASNCRLYNLRVYGNGSYGIRGGALGSIE